MCWRIRADQPGSALSPPENLEMPSSAIAPRGLFARHFAKIETLCRWSRMWSSLPAVRWLTRSKKKLKRRSSTLLGLPMGERVVKIFQNFLSVAAAILIRAYQLLISPALPGSCRFNPSCSHYAMEAFRRHSPARATWLAFRRIARCHPFHPGGEDPVP